MCTCVCCSYTISQRLSHHECVLCVCAAGTTTATTCPSPTTTTNADPMNNAKLPQSEDELWILDGRAAGSVHARSTRQCCCCCFCRTTESVQLPKSFWSRCCCCDRRRRCVCNDEICLLSPLLSSLSLSLSLSLSPDNNNASDERELTYVGCMWLTLKSVSYVLKKSLPFDDRGNLKGGGRGRWSAGYEGSLGDYKAQRQSQMGLNGHNDKEWTRKICKAGNVA